MLDVVELLGSDDAGTVPIDEASFGAEDEEGKEMCTMLTVEDATSVGCALGKDLDPTSRRRLAVVLRFIERVVLSRVRLAFDPAFYGRPVDPFFFVSLRIVALQHLVYDGVDTLLAGMVGIGLLGRVHDVELFVVIVVKPQRGKPVGLP